MKKSFLFVIFILFQISILFSQSVGFSYFIPRNGYFSNPIAPLNISMPINAGNYLQISPGIGMMSVGGLSLVDLPDSYSTKLPLIGPFQTAELNILVALSLPINKIKISAQGGAFMYYGFNQKFITGNFDRSIAEIQNFQAVFSNVDFKKHGFGGGYIYGGKLTYRLSKKLSVYAGLNYYSGKQKYPISGNFTAYTSADSKASGNFKFDNSRIDYSGFMILFGIVNQ